MKKTNKLTLTLLEDLVNSSADNYEGKVATYIPELAKANEQTCAIAVQEIGHASLVYSKLPLEPVTLQSVAKLIPLIGLLEEYGVDQLLDWVNVEPSGDEFSSITRLAQFGPMPSNPMLNAGAITLCSHIPGTYPQQYTWLEHWLQKLFQRKLAVNTLVLNSEKRTGDRNRALAYLLKSRQCLGADVNEALDLYFTLCSYEACVDELLHLPVLLSNGGLCPETNQRIIREDTCQITLAIMATCGLYDESGTYLVKTGMPGKSGVSGFILAVAPGKGGVVVLSPLVNPKGNSVRGELMLETLSKTVCWHFLQSRK